MLTPFWMMAAYFPRPPFYSKTRPLPFGGRWTAPGSFAAVHASLDVKTAVAESLGTQQQYGIAVAARLPLTLVAIDVRLQELIDLADEDILAEMNLKRQKLLRCRWRESIAKGRELVAAALQTRFICKSLEGKRPVNRHLAPRGKKITFMSSLTCVSRQARVPLVNMGDQYGSNPFL
jgi:RES domain-containing protein